MGLVTDCGEVMPRSKDTVGNTPAKLKNAGAKVYKYADSEKLAKRIEEAATAAGK